MRILIFYAFLVSLSSTTLSSECVIEKEGLPIEAQHVSMVSLIAHGKNYVDKFVSITGVLNFHSHDQLFVYKDKNSIDYLILSESIQLIVDDLRKTKNLEMLKRIEGEYVSVLGKIALERDMIVLDDIWYLCVASTRESMNENAKKAKQKWGPKENNR